MDNINSKFQRNGNLPPAQRGIATQAAAANRYSQEAIRKGDNGRIQAHLQRLFENNGVPAERAKLLAERWRTATDFKYASEQALGRRDLSTEDRATHQDRIDVADVTILQVEDLARRNFRPPSSMAQQAELRQDAAPDNS
ncbi:hypothetical protein [Caenimonas sp. SL110]|uniref:hypothetical protein n=1 Tax=Caenimonas sp. SL110 TaxID=1450524 RepID=UPI000652F3E0|nr:hypothetical protein [Caenimonas sp. SL110]